MIRPAVNPQAGFRLEFKLQFIGQASDDIVGDGFPVPRSTILQFHRKIMRIRNILPRGSGTPRSESKRVDRTTGISLLRSVTGGDRAIN